VKAKVLGDLMDAKDMTAREAGISLTTYMKAFKKDPQVTDKMMMMDDG
jgi:hypothetical protein